MYIVVSIPLFCRPTINSIICVACFKCGLPILDDSAELNGNPHHLTCLVCEECGIKLLTEIFEQDGVLYCQRDYMKKFGKRCEGCGENIVGAMLDAGGMFYHPDCFKCARCKRVFESGDSFSIDKGCVLFNV